MGTVEEDPDAKGLSLQLANTLDCTTLLPVPLAGLNRSVYVRSICYHPDKPFLAVGVPGFVGAYDLNSGCRIGRIDIRATAIELKFSSDGSLLIVATAEWDILGINTSTWRTSKVAPRANAPDKPLDSIHMVLSYGPKPVVLFCKHGKDAVRMAYTHRAVQRDAKGRPMRQKEHKWGIKLKMDVKKPIVGLAAHTTDHHIMVYHADGVLRGYTMSSDAALVPIYACPVEFTPGAKVAPAFNMLEVLPHPFLPGGVLLLQGSRAGLLALLEVQGRAEPRLLLKTRLPGAVIGLGYLKAARAITVYSKNELGTVNAHCWQLHGGIQKPGTLSVAGAPVVPAQMGELLREVKAVQHAGDLEDVDSAADAWQQLWSPTTPWFSQSQDSGVEALTPEVARVAVHPNMGIVALQLQPPRQARLQPALMAQSAATMSPAEIAVLRATLAVPVAQALSNDAAYCGHAGAAYSTMHTAVDFWTSSAGPSAKLQFPRHLYYLGGGQINKYALASKACGQLLKLPADNGDGRSIVAAHMVHSPKKGAWLLFFSLTQSTDVEAGARWVWTLVREGTIGYQDENVWLNAGKYGAFIGPTDSQFAILNPTGSLLSIYSTDTTAAAASAPLYTIGLIRPSFASPAIFPGPPCAALPPVPQPPPQNAPSGGSPGPTPRPNLMDLEATALPTGGLVLWYCSDGALAMGTLPAPPLDTDPKAVPQMGKVKRERTLPLDADERVLQVGWQSLLPGGAVTDGNSCAAAVLTSKRLLLVSGMMNLIASTGRVGAGGVAQPVTSFLWAGPALLYTTSSGQVMQLTWTGESHTICSVASSPPALLAGALADSLLLLRRTTPAPGIKTVPAADDNFEVTSRVVSMLQPLVIGWCTLSAAGLLPAGAGSVRVALQSVLERYDATQVSNAMLWSLINCWCWDVAAVLANNGPHVDLESKTAANAAAGHWGAVTRATIQEYERSIYVPHPPPAGSQLHKKLTAAACGAIMHGQFSQALTCLKAAGAWETCIALMVCQGDLEGVRQLALQMQKATSVGSADLQLGVRSATHAAEVARMARAVSAAYAGASTGATRDWKAKLVTADGSVVAPADAWRLARSGCVPGMETAAFNSPPQLIEAGELGAVPNADTSQIGSFLGLSDLTAVEVAPTASRANSSALDMSMDAAGGGLGDLLGPEASGVSLAGAEMSSDSESISSKATSAAGGVKVGRKTTKDSFFDSDDEGEDASPSAARKFKIQIRSKDEAAAGTAAVVAPPGNLKEAAKNLKLESPRGRGIGGLGAASKGRVGGTSASSSSSALHDLDLSDFTGSARPSPRGITPPLSASSSTSNLSATPPGHPSLLKPPLPSPPSSRLGAPPTALPSPPLATPSSAPSDPFDFGFAPTPSSTQPSPASAPFPTPPGSAPSPGPIDLDDLLGFGPSPASTPVPTPTQPVMRTPAAAAAAAPAAGTLLDLDDLLSPAAPQVQAAAAPIPSPSGGSMEQYLAGVHYMETAQWPGAKAAFTSALKALAAEPKVGNHTQRVAFCSQYYAVVRLLEEAAKGQGPREAKLYRFASALKLDEKHQMALLKESVNRNKHVGNFRYCADQLTVLITKSLGTAPMDYMAKLQESIDECDRAGSSNHDIPADENLEVFVEIVSAAAAASDVDVVVESIIAS